jgi:hypothetical protein
MRESLPRLLDAVTTFDGPVIRGRINVNLAPRVVLWAIPGLDRAAVEQIVAARGNRNSSHDPNRRYATWLLTEGVLDLPRMRKVEPCLTAGGDVYRAQMVGYYDDGGQSIRAQVVVDAAHSPPRVVYWKDLRILGPGYPR